MLLHQLRRLLAHLVVVFVHDKDKKEYIKNLVTYGVLKKYLEQRKAAKIKNFKYGLAVLAIIKNEGPYLREWIEFHKMMGVDKFFIYDNESNDNTKEILEPYIKSGLVEYTYFPGQKMQLPAYNDWLQKHKFDVKWLAIIDLDEFIVPKKHNSIKEYLAGLDRGVSQVLINWLMFGSNGHKTKPDGLVIESYTKRAKETPNHKAIIKPYQVCFIAVHGHAVAGRTIKPSIDIIRTHHYFCKSFEEYSLKAGRGDVFYGSKAALHNYNIKNFKGCDKNEVVDTAALRFLPELKRNLNNK